MYATCPKCGHQPGAGAATLEACPACGIVYRKWLQKQLGTAMPAAAATGRATDSAGPAIMNRLLEKLLHTEASVNPFVFWGRAAGFVLVALLGWTFLRADFVTDYDVVGNHFMHRVDLVFHEAGHVVFRPFGWLLTVAGGSLFQVIMPAFLAGMFVFKYGNPFAAAVCIAWTGQSFIDLAPYIDDALDRNLMLLGGTTGAESLGRHDWANILGEFDVLERHREYAGIASACGKSLIILGLLWGAVLLYRQYRRLEKF